MCVCVCVCVCVCGCARACVRARFQARAACLKCLGSVMLISGLPVVPHSLVGTPPYLHAQACEHQLGARAQNMSV